MTPIQKQKLRYKIGGVINFINGRLEVPIDSPLHSLLKYHPANKDRELIETIEWTCRGFLGYKPK